MTAAYFVCDVSLHDDCHGIQDWDEWLCQRCSGIRYWQDTNWQQTAVIIKQYTICTRCCGVMMIRVFPRRTKWTPNDDLVFIGEPPIIGQPDKILPVCISCSFTWDINECERLYRSWKSKYPKVYLGGPALQNITWQDDRSEFVSGRFIKEGVTITSRGCPKNCSYCFAWRWEGNEIRELKIKDGYIIQDNNILACSMGHFEGVIEMLSRQKKAARFMGMDADFLTEKHVDLLARIRVDRMLFSYDHSGDTYYLEQASDLLSDYNRNKKRCYVLIGYNGETLENAEKRLLMVWKLGFMPFAQFYRDERFRKDKLSKDWADLTRIFSRPAIMRGYCKKHDNSRSWTKG